MSHDILHTPTQDFIKILVDYLLLMTYAYQMGTAYENCQMKKTIVFYIEMIILKATEQNDT